MLINNNNFLLKEIPNYHPILEQYDRLSFWKEQKRYCIEGYWSSGKWMPGPLYYYVNFHHINIESKSGSQVTSLPFLRDIDWELFFLYEECRGFSGFSKDLKHTCDRKYGPEKEEAILFGQITRKEADSKIYIPARDYLRTVFSTKMGKPLYNNSAKNFISVQSRGGGKTYSTSGICGHNFIFDGAKDYDQYINEKKNNTPLKSETIIGAIDAKYSNILVSKVKEAFSYYKGGYETEGVIYQPPFLPTYTGSFLPSKSVTSSTNSKLHHFTFADNPLVANGTRGNIYALDEIGFLYNIHEVVEAIEGSSTSKEFRNTVIWMLGTGGLVSGKAALYAEGIMRNPEEYNCLSFDDEYENRGSIGYFVPYWKTLNQFKEGVNKVTNEPLARAYIEKRREKAKKAPDPRKYQGEIINGPIVPSEAFLILEGSFFPVMLLKSQLSECEGGKYRKYLEASFKGHLVFNDKKELYFNTVQDARPIRNYPLEKDTDKSGCIEIWIKPQKNDEGVIPRNVYIGGIDVVDKDNATTSSLPSIIIMNRFTRQIVAEYTGRSGEAKDFYEICRKLLLYYNAVGMYEKNLIGLYNYFDQKKCTYLLAETPYQLRSTDTYKAGTNTSKGINANTKINSEGRNMIKSWLLETVSDVTGMKVLETIYSPAILKELIMWNPDGNFDRVSSLGMLMWFDSTIFREEDKRVKEVKTFLEGDYWKNMGVLRQQPISLGFGKEDNNSIISNFKDFNNSF